jgi:hypothetical protein
MSYLWLLISVENGSQGRTSRPDCTQFREVARNVKEEKTDYICLIAIHFLSNFLSPRSSPTYCHNSGRKSIILGD